jgi:hypothetical protein
MRIGKVLRVVSLVTAFALLSSPSPALADQVVVDDLIVQGNLCVGALCVDGEMFGPSGQVRAKGTSPSLLLHDTDNPQQWAIALNAASSLIFRDLTTAPARNPLVIEDGAPDETLHIQGATGNVGIGTAVPSQKFHVRQNQNANTFLLVENATNGLNANAVVRTQADTAIQNFQSHATSRTLVRWGVPLGGWNEFLAVQGNGLAMGTVGTAPFILGTSATARMSFDGDSNVISFGGGGQYDGNSFLDASSRALKQDIRPLGPDAAIETLAGLEPVTFAYTGAPGDPRVGFVAEDVPELVATPDRKTLSALEIVAVLTKVVKEQQKALAELTAKLATLEARP